MMKYSAIVLLGGSSTRFASNGLNKVYLPINGKPLFTYSVNAFLSDKDCEKIIVVYNKKDYDIIKDYTFDRTTFVPGGAERYDSVLCGLNATSSEYVLVHDGARPYVNLELIERVKEGLNKQISVSLGVPVTDTIKEVTNKVKTIDRENLWYIQTPQGSKRIELVKMLSQIKKEDKITDDLMAFEKYSNVTPLIVLGDKKNIKVTTMDDYEYIKYLMETKNV